MFKGALDEVGGTMPVVDDEEHGVGGGIMDELGGSDGCFCASSLLSLHRNERMRGTMTPGALIFKLTRGRSAAGGDTERCSEMVCLTLTFSVPMQRMISLHHTRQIFPKGDTCRPLEKNFQL